MSIPTLGWYTRSLSGDRSHAYSCSLPPLAFADLFPPSNHHLMISLFFSRLSLSLKIPARAHASLSRSAHTPPLPPRAPATTPWSSIRARHKRRRRAATHRLQTVPPMAAPAAASPVAPGAGRLSRLRAPRVGLRGGAVAAAAAVEGPSCLYVGPIETASQEMLEALYQQARDSYYSGQPLIVDDMFDKVELKLRVYGSPSVVKYPRCSLKRHSTYADAEEDHSMLLALSSIWMLLLLFGTSAFLAPSLYTLSLAFGEAFGARYLLYGEKSLDMITRVNDMVLVGLGYLVGYPIASASVGALQGLLTNNLVALKGSCPNCGEQVFAFVKTDKSIKAPHRAECHVCECPLEYRTNVERSLSGPRRSWVYGRVYLVKQGHPRKRRWMKD